ncbi:spore coat protein [Paenibacillus sp. 1001270B_150601_E10]|uniref:spore coat protein n=1 Tax=Paenibacillus sp. 1001270B_150601_E10 TaxID=2787079 RepID=UPI00189D735E|nr:spore coat protein [Paenibacillus sp. 1001270B_150601_E10]
MHQSSFMQEEDLLYTILADLKRTSREYTTAVTEASCPVVRQMFMNLTNDTLKLQSDLYYLMDQLNMYSASTPVLKQEIDKQLQQNQQTMQKTQQFVQQKLGSHQMQHGTAHYYGTYASQQPQSYQGHSYM